MTTTILRPHGFNFLFYLFIFLIGVDYLWSGYLIIKNNSISFVKPRLLGVWFGKRLLALKTTVNSNSAIMNFLCVIKNLGVLSIVCGMLLIISSGIMIFEILVT